jgi:hypothetical protein
MKYEITIPGADAMLAQEQMSRKTPAVPVEKYNGRVAYHVTWEINREHWLSHHQDAVHKVLALIQKLGNAPGWQNALVDEVARQLGGPTHLDGYEKYDVQILHRHCPMCGSCRLSPREMPTEPLQFCRTCGWEN